MDIKFGNDYPSGALSNLASRKFIFRGIQCNSVEGVLQGLKWRDIDEQTRICSYTGRKAQAINPANYNWTEHQILFWQGHPIDRNSQEYQTLLDELYSVMFAQNPKAQQALLDTGHENLTHNVGWHNASETILTKREFCDRLMDMRKYLQTKDLIGF